MKKERMSCRPVARGALNFFFDSKGPPHPTPNKTPPPRRGARICCRGGLTTAVYSGRPRRRGSRVDKHQIKVHSVHRIFRAIFFFFAIVKKFVEKKIGGREQGGHDPPLDPRLPPPLLSSKCMLHGRGPDP